MVTFFFYMVTFLYIDNMMIMSELYMVTFFFYMVTFLYGCILVYIDIK